MSSVGFGGFGGPEVSKKKGQTIRRLDMVLHEGAGGSERKGKVRAHDKDDSVQWMIGRWVFLFRW